METFMKILNCFFCLILSVATYATEPQSQFDMTTLKESLVCVSDCSTAVGENNEACYPNEIAEYNLKSSKIIQSTLTTGGLDGDQLDEVSFQISDLQGLYAGDLVRILGIQRKGYNYGADYISSWAINCSLKN